MSIQYKEGYGYQVVTDGTEPTDLQIKLQDVVDNEINNAVAAIITEYAEGATIDFSNNTAVTKWDLDPVWDIHKISQIRELIEKLYGLPEVY